MEQAIFSKFSVYDQIGFLTVGTLFLLFLIFNTVYFYQINIPEISLNILLVWLIVAYFLGHFVQEIANLINSSKVLNFLIPGNKQDFDDQEKEILQQAKKELGLEEINENSLWSFCYIFVVMKDITGQVQAFNAYYSLYRGWLVVFLLESFFLLYALIIFYNKEVLALFLISIFFTFIFYRRSRRYWKHIKNKVFKTFIVIKTLKT